MIHDIRALFDLQFGPSDDVLVYFSPGRVNLIGEHIDYNGGFVLPTALSLGNEGAFRLRDDRTIRLYSENFAGAGIVATTLDHLAYRREDSWANYAKGVVREMAMRGGTIDRGFDAAVHGDLPQASGLSSSASIELLFACFLNDAFGLGYTRPDLAVLCRKVENEYIGVHCGIMDQFVIANGRKDCALLLDCATLAYTPVPLALGECSIVIVNSKVKRGLVDSKYNERRRECDRALSILKESVAVDHLCDLDEKTFRKHASALGDGVLYRRAKHAVTENARTRGALEQLRRGDVAGFGRAMDASHASLRDDYEVSIPELDLLVDLAGKNGALGARMTGAGFGGCTVNIVPKGAIPAFSDEVAEGYYKAYGLMAEIYVAEPSDGVRRIG
ncbi:MAG: galactokinase [Candidatus Izemoplasmatales bacterium]